MGSRWFEEGERRDVFELVRSGQILEALEGRMKALVFRCNGSVEVFPRSVI